MRIRLTILLIFIILLCFGTLFASSSSFVNTYTAPKWYVFIFCSVAIMVTFALFNIFSDIKKLQPNNLVLPVCLIITILCTIQALYGIAQYMRLLPVFGRNRVTGSFDNPAGFAACLCAGFPFFFYFLSKRAIWIRCMSIAGMIIVGLAIIISGSRSGLLALATVCVLGFFYLFQINKTQKIFIGILSAILLSSLYFIKRDSADGRLLIWRCSWEMIKEKPVTGFGTGGFKANYMNYQAKYFVEHPDSKYAMLADNIGHPFNEYIGLLVNYGFIGFLGFLLFSFILIRSFTRIKEKTLFTYIAAWCLTAIAIFALFSYPLRYPFVWVVGLLSCSVILFQGNEKAFKKFKAVKRFYVPALILLLTLIICFKSYSRLMVDTKWCKTAHLSLEGRTEQMLPEYQLLHAKLSNNELFLYNYAAELNYSKHYEESLSIARECESLWADYDLQMLIADDCQQIKDYPEAEQHYQKAKAMCPVKFVPLYKLFQLYEVTGEKENMRKIAETIISKPVKIMSPTVNQIKKEVKQKMDCL